MPRSPKWSLLFIFIDQNFISISHLTNSCCKTHQSQPIFYYVHYISLFYVHFHTLRVWIHQRNVFSPALIFKPFIVEVCFNMT